MLKRFPFLLYFTFVIVVLSGSVAAQSGDPEDPPPFVSILDFGANGSKFPPSRAELTPPEEKIFVDYVKSLHFPKYIFSGCNDRAHAAYLMMPPALRDKVSKVWVISPSKHSASVKGVIKLSPNIPDSLDVRWGFHVALAYTNEDGLQVYDAGIAQGKVLPGDVWFSSMKPAPLSFWTMTAGRIYLFYPTNAPFSTNKDIWGGDAHEYTGQSAAENWIPTALARDAVGEAILKERRCDSIRTEAKDPDALMDRLKKGNIPPECEDLIDLFKTQKQVWIDKLKT